jgi:cytosine deaminase
MMNDFMMAAIEEALKGRDEGGIPIGSVLVHKGHIIGRGHNRRIQKDSVILHAEMDALENAGRLTAATYKDCVIYTTLSPCPMCTGAILLYGIPTIVVGENQTFMGGEELLKANNREVIVENNSECIGIMQQFIQQHPELWNEDIGK